MLNDNALDDNRVAVFNEDAWQWLDKQGDLFDVIVVDLPDPDTVDIARLYTVEFYKKIQRRLSVDGVMITQASSPWIQRRAFWCVASTLKTVFSSVNAVYSHVPSFGFWGYVMASNGPMKKHRDIPGETQYIKNENWQNSLQHPNDLSPLNLPANYLQTLVLMQYYNYKKGYKAMAVSMSRNIKILITIVSFCMLSISSACSVFGKQTVEEAPYRLVRSDNQFEVRDYEPMVVAETRVKANFDQAGRIAFRRLFRYISGENESATKIAMTAPVIAESNNDSQGVKIAMTAPVTSSKKGEIWRYQFVLPRTYTIETAPTPTNSDVLLVEIKPQRVATIRFSGRTTTEAQIARTEQLIDWIRQQGLEQLSEPRWAGYNAPFTIPAFRRNEVLIDVDGK